MTVRNLCLTARKTRVQSWRWNCHLARTFSLKWWIETLNAGTVWLFFPGWECKYLCDTPIGNDLGCQTLLLQAQNELCSLFSSTRDCLCLVFLPMPKEDVLFPQCFVMDHIVWRASLKKKVSFHTKGFWGSWRETFPTSTPVVVPRMKAKKKNCLRTGKFHEKTSAFCYLLTRFQCHCVWFDVRRGSLPESSTFQKGETDLPKTQAQSVHVWSTVLRSSFVQTHDGNFLAQGSTLLFLHSGEAQLSGDACHLLHFDTVALKGQYTRPITCLESGAQTI